MLHSSWRKLARVFCAAAVAVGFAAQTQAVPTVFTGADPGEGLDLDGTFIYAINVGPNAGPGLIRDARFRADAGFVQGAIVTAQNNIGTGGGWGGPNFGGGIDDSRLANVMSSIRWSGAPADVVVTMPNLTIGETYKMQVLLGEQCCNRGFDVKVDGVTIETAVNPGVIHGGAHSTSNKGAVVTHEFVATSNTVTLTLDQNVPGFPDNNPILNGLTLEHVSAGAPVAVSNVTIGRFTGADEGEGLDLQGAPGSFTHAVNVGGPAMLVGDVQFANGNPGNNAPNSVVGAFNHIPGWTTPNLGSSPADDALEQVVNSIRWTAENQDSGDLTVELSDLQAGQTYKVQLMFTESCCDNRGFDVFVDEQLTIDDFAPGLVQGGATGAPTAGSVITFEFLATDGHVNIRLNGINNGNFTDQNPILSAFTVENVTIPEPASAMLGVLGAAALAFRRRRAA